MPDKTDGRETLFEAILFGTDGCIERQELQGQRQLAVDDELPTDGLDNPVLAAWGVVKVGPKRGDPMFCHAKLPAGWKKVPTSHQMYTDIVDDKGRTRASIFYKAAFYDRHANIRPCQRFHASGHKDDWNDRDAQYFPAILEGDKIVWRGEFVKTGEKHWEAADKARKIAEKRLMAKFPNYADPDQYWDIDSVDFGISLSEAPKKA